MLDLRTILDKNGLGDLIGRDASSLRQEEWQAIDDEVVETLRPSLVARLKLKPLLDNRFKGAGWTQIKGYKASDRSLGKVDLDGEPEDVDLRTLSEFLTKAPVLHAESKLAWRQLEASRNGREPLDVTAAADAAAIGGQLEENLLWRGDSDLGIDGFANATGKSTTTGGNWSTTPADAITDIKAMWAYLTGKNTLGTDSKGVTFAGPKLLVMNPQEAEFLGAPRSSTSDTTVLEFCRKNGYFDDYVVTPFQPAGTVAMRPVNRAYVRWFLMEDWQTDELATTGRNKVLSTYSIQTLQNRQGASCVERTAVDS